jgi:hypothetical protein
MIAMKFTIELDIGLSFLLQAALPQLVTNRETKTHRRGRSSDRTATADAALRSRKRNPHRRRGLVMDRAAGERKSNSRKTPTRVRTALQPPPSSSGHRERPPALSLPEPITNPAAITHLRIHRHDRLGGLLHEYEHAT